MFDAGAIQAHLDVDLAEFNRKLDEAEARVKRFEDEPHKIKITAEVDQGAIAQARRDMTKLDQQLTRDAVQRSKTAQGSLLGTLARMGGDKTAGGKLAAGLGAAPLLAVAGASLLPALGTLGGVGLGAGIAGGGALAAGGGALAAFASIAKPVLTQAQGAAAAVEKAQQAYNLALATGANRAKAYATEQQAIKKAYEQMSPAQIALSKQLAAMGDAWDKVKAKETPVVAGALQPWLKTITDVMGKLNPIIVQVSGVIGSLGKQFDVLINSPTFTKFRDFIAGTGSFVVGQAGRSLLDVVQALMTLLPQFAPLIEAGARGVGHLADKFLAWSQSAQARKEIADFLKWFKENGPSVGRFIENVAKAIAHLAPGLAAGGAAELNVLSTFLGWVAKMPAGAAGPITAIAGAALLLAKLPGGQKVITFAVNLVGAGAAALLSAMGVPGAGKLGKAFGLNGDTAAAKMKAAFDAGGTEAAAKMKEAMTTGGTVAAGEEAGAAGAAGGALGLGGKLKGVGGKLLGGAGWGSLAYFGGQAIVGATSKPGTTGNKWGQVGVDTATGAAAGAMFGPIGAGVGAAIGLAIGLATQFHHQIAHIWDDVRHETANIFDGMRHEVAHIWDMMFQDTIGATIRAQDHLQNLITGWLHDMAHWYDVARHDVASIWDLMWNNTIGRAERGIHDVAVMFDEMRHGIASRFDSIRHDIAHYWDVIYNNTIGALIRFGAGVGDRFTAVKNWIWQHFITDVSNWFTQTLPNMFTKATDLIGNAWDWVKGKISGPIKTVASYTIVPLFQGIDMITNFVAGKNPLAGAIKTLQNLATGGRISHGTTETADDVLIRASRGETVVSAAHSRLPFMQTAFALAGVPGYQQGGGVGRGAGIPRLAYTNPVGAGAVPARIDMGVDYTGTFPLYALGAGTILNLYNRLWPGGTYMTLKLDTGPDAGKIWYYAEHIVPDMMVGPGIHVNRGQRVGWAPGGSPWTELGWSADATGTTMAAATGQADRGRKAGDAGRYSTQYGVDASLLIQQLGGPGGIISPGGISGGGHGIFPAIGGFIVRTAEQILNPLGKMFKTALDLFHGDIPAAERAILSIFKPGAGGAFTSGNGQGLGDTLLGLPFKMTDQVFHKIIGWVKSFVTGQQQGPGGPSGPLPAAAGPFVAYAKKLLAAYGWSAQWPAFNNLEMHEAGYRPDAQNPTSTAYGIGQFLDSTWATVGGTKTSNGYLQLQYMMKYIAQRYTDPNHAWAQYFQHPGGQGSYAKGGPINEPVIGFGLGSGRPYSFGENGREWVSPAGPGGGPAGGAMIGHVSITLPEGQTVASALSELSFWLRVAQQQGYAGVMPGG